MRTRGILNTALLSACAITLAGLASAPDAGAAEPASVETAATEQAADAPPPLPDFDPERVTEANVIEVIDGDSLVLLIDGELRKFEIQGADAPEWIERQSNRSAASEHAKRFLTNLIGGERVAIYEPEPGWTDQLRRRRGYLYRLPDRTLIDLEIVRQGYGKVSTRASNPFAPTLRWYEARARELSRGVWGPEDTRTQPEPTPEPATTQAPATRPADPEPAEDPAPEPADDDGWVWITKSGSKYHREGCHHLSSSRKRVRRDSIDTTHEPCRTCAPG